MFHGRNWAPRLAGATHNRRIAAIPPAAQGRGRIERCWRGEVSRSDGWRQANENKCTNGYSLRPRCWDTLKAILEETAARPSLLFHKIFPEGTDSACCIACMKLTS